MLNSPWISNHIPQWNNSFCRHVRFVTSERQDPKFGGFSIGYVHVTSKPADSQVLSSSPAGITLLPLCPVRHLWTAGLWVWCFLVGYVQFITSEPTGTQIYFLSMVLKLLCPVRHLWIDKSITLFSFSLSGPRVLCYQVNMTTSEQRIASLVFLSWSCPICHLWTDGCLNLFHASSPKWASYNVNIMTSSSGFKI